MVDFADIRRWLLKSFVGICFIGLLLPNITLFNEKENEAIVRKENRRITAFPSYSLTDKRFYPDFEKFYQDRLFGRDYLIYAWSILNYKCKVILKDNYVVGKNGWLFAIGHNVKTFRDKKLKLDAVKKIQNYCIENKVNFIFIVPPYKNAVYADYLPQRIRSAVPLYGKIENELIDECKKAKINYISLYDPLLKGRKNFHRDVYWWDDHHWSYEGASIAADIILKHIKEKNANFRYDGIPFDGTFINGSKECSQVKALGVEKLSNRRAKVPWSRQFTKQIFGIDKYTSKKVQFVKEPISNNYLQEKIVRGESIVINKSTTNDVKLLFLCDSYGGYMSTYVSQFVKKMINTHYVGKVEIKKSTNLNYLIKEYKPDFVILEISAPDFYNSKDDSKLKHIVF